ncbi:S-layer homology domain-containing protein [bacterium]|nr:S-layer homology domain-containing protein [bacterium]
MKLNKMTLAAFVTIGILAGTNAGFTQEAQNDSQNVLVAACPLSGCQKHKTTSCDSCKKISDDCNQCPPIAQCPTPSAPTCAVCPGSNDGKKFEQQVYAYPNAIYGHNQVVGERNNGLYLGDDSTYAFRGVPVADGTTSNCGCDDGSMTGAAASIPCLDNTPMGMGIPVDRNPSNLDSAGCPVQIHTNTSMEAVRHSIEPFEYKSQAMTGGAAPVVSAYEDVPNGYWASCDINKLTCNNILAGYPDGRFKPGTPITRAEIATMMVKGLDLDYSDNYASDMFNDVPSDHWANRTIASAVTNGYMSGYPNNEFKPNQNLSRAEAFAIMAKGINCPMDECKADEVLSHYNDGNSVPNWAKVPVAKVLEQGGISDFPSPNTIAPNRDASRAEVASMLENVRVAMGYSKDDNVACDCDCEPKQAFFQNEEVVTIPTLQLTFNDEISAKSAHIGDRFAATTIDAVTINGVEFPAGSRVDGKVLEVVRPTKNCQGAIKLSFNTIKFGKCKATLPNQILTAQVNRVKKPNGFARLVEFPFTWTGGLLGNVGRTVGGAIVSASNAVEQVVSGVGVGTGEIFQGQFKAAGRSYVDVGKAIVTAPVDVTRTALSGTMGLFQYTGDEITYLVDPRGMKVSSVNPKEKVTIAFGCQQQ